MSVPVNAAAREIVRVRGLISDLETQEGELRARKLELAEMIGALSLTAAWEPGDPPGSVPLPPDGVPEPETDEGPAE